jgi:transposase
MGNRRISSDLKESALRLWELGWSRSDICFALSVSQDSIYRWAKIFEEFGSVNQPQSPLQVHPRIIALAAITAIKGVYTQHPDTFLDELQWFLAIHHDIAISISALQDNLEKAGLTRKILHKIASERDEERRAEFMHSIRNDFSGTGDEFVMVDESSKNEHSIARRYGHSPAGRTADLVDPFIRGQRYSLVAAMSKCGYIATHVIPGSFDSFAFFDFIVEDVVCSYIIHFKQFETYKEWE